MSYEGNTYSTNSGTIVTGAKYPNRMMTVGVLFTKTEKSEADPSRGSVLR